MNFTSRREKEGLYDLLGKKTIWVFFEPGGRVQYRTRHP